MAVGLLEAVGLVEQYGRDAKNDDVISVDDLLFVANAKRRLGCKSVRSTLSRSDRERLISIGKLIKTWRDDK